MCVCMSLVWQRLMNCRKFTIHTAHISATAWECMLKMTSCARMCALCVYVHNWEQPHGRIRFLYCSIVKIKWDSCINASAHSNIQTESKLKYCQPHTTIVLFCFLPLFYSGGKTPFTHSENKKCETITHKVFIAQELENRKRNSENERKREIEIASKADLFVEWHVDLTIFSLYLILILRAHHYYYNMLCVFVYAWCVHCVLL